ncbi:MAG: terminase large subunit domain-containing protein [Armatimonadota bacterium]
MTIPEIRLPNPHPGQRAVRRGARRFNFLAAGRRWRKTTLCMAIAVERAVRGAEILWGAPTYDQVRIGWDETKRAAGAAADFHEGRMECRFPKGRILFRSLDHPDNARGHTADGCVVDEAADVEAAAWHEVLRPMLITTQGWAWVTGTPRGRNWFWTEWRKAADGELADAAAWQAPTLGTAIRDGRPVRMPHPLENPDIPFSEIEALWGSLPERAFRQEILAEFVEDGGGVFRNVRAVSVLAPGAPLAGHVYCCGIDWGRTHDFTVFSVWDATEKRQVWLERVTGLDFITQASRLLALCERWRPDIVLAESNSIGRPMIEYLQRAGVPVRGFEMTQASKLRLVDAYTLGFERQAFQLLDDPRQIDEHEAFEQHALPGGLLRFSAPAGEHDDTVIANALAWSLAQGVSDDPLEEDEPDPRTVLEAYPGLKRFPGLARRLGRA